MATIGRTSSVHDSDSDSSVSQYEALDVTKDDGWQDVETDEESTPIVGLFSDKVFPDVQSMLRDCKDSHNFDFARVQKDLGVYCCRHATWGSR